MAERGDPFREAGMWPRCALQAHTTNWDGEPAPDVPARSDAWAGNDVLASTDRWARGEARAEGLLVLPSAELAGKRRWSNPLWS